MSVTAITAVAAPILIQYGPQIAALGIAAAQNMLRERAAGSMTPGEEEAFEKHISAQLEASIAAKESEIERLVPRHPG